MEARSVPSDGQRGGGKRVLKFFPRIDRWETTVEYYIVDETITREVFEHVLDQAGKFIGVGSFRVRNNGVWGRFKIASLKWEEA